MVVPIQATATSAGALFGAVSGAAKDLAGSPSDTSTTRPDLEERIDLTGSPEDEMLWNTAADSQAAREGEAQETEQRAALSQSGASLEQPPAPVGGEAAGKTIPL